MSIGTASANSMEFRGIEIYFFNFDLLCFFSILCLLCLCALLSYVLCGHLLGKG